MVVVCFFERGANLDKESCLQNECFFCFKGEREMKAAPLQSTFT